MDNYLYLEQVRIDMESKNIMEIGNLISNMDMEYIIICKKINDTDDKSEKDNKDKIRKNIK